MTDVWEFLDKSSGKNENKQSGEPILIRASEISSDPKYSEMRKINPLTAEPNSIYPCVDIKKKFYLQAGLMADFSDDYKITKVHYRSYYPRYDILTFNELRGYFSWRTSYRKDEIIDVSITFLLIYVSEIVNGVGIDDSNDGFSKLTRLQKDYEHIPGFDISGCISDYAVYNSIKHHRKDSFTERLSMVFDSIKNMDFSDTLEILSEFSNYKVTNSKFYSSEYKYLLSDVLPQIFQRMDDFYKKHRKITLFAKLFGRQHEINWRPFSGILFYSEAENKDREVVVNGAERYVIKNGKWRLFTYYELNLNRKLIGEIIRTTEHFLRDMTGFSHKIKLKSTSKILTDLIKEAVHNYLSENNLFDLSKKKKEKVIEEVFEPVIVNIDKSKFESIRKISNELKEKLIIEEPEEEPQEVTFLEKTEEAGGFDGFLNALTAVEVEVLKALLNDIPIKEILDREKIMPEVILESINEKALEQINDNIIDSGGLSIYDDYKDELLEVLC